MLAASEYQDVTHRPDWQPSLPRKCYFRFDPTRYSRRYHGYLAPRYPDRYFEAYRKLLLPFADRGMGRGHYFQIVQYLKKMKAITGYESETLEIAKSLKQRYARRPAFQDGLRAL